MHCLNYAVLLVSGALRQHTLHVHNGLFVEFGMLLVNVARIKLKSVLLFVEVESPGFLGLIEAIEMEAAGGCDLLELVLGLITLGQLDLSDPLVLLGIERVTDKQSNARRFTH